MAEDKTRPLAALQDRRSRPLRSSGVRRERKNWEVLQQRLREKVGHHLHLKEG